MTVLKHLKCGFFRRISRISYTEHKTNEQVLNMVNEKRGLLTEIKKRKLQYFGHIIRDDGKQKQLLDGKIQFVRKRGRQRRK